MLINLHWHWCVSRSECLQWIRCSLCRIPMGQPSNLGSAMCRRKILMPLVMCGLHGIFAIWWVHFHCERSHHECWMSIVWLFVWSPSMVRWYPVNRIHNQSMHDANVPMTSTPMTLSLPSCEGKFTPTF